MKNTSTKFFLLASIVILLAAGCGSQPTAQNYPVKQTQSTPIPTPTPTLTPTAVPSVANTVQITLLTPATGPTASLVTISGRGFTPTGNKIIFGDSNGSHHPDGSADNVLATVDSKDGKTLSFTVPSSGPSGILCNAQNHCVGISAIRRLPGKYNVSVSNQNGTSNILVFTIK